MRFEKVLPTDKLTPYVKYFVISESELENTYKIYPSTNLVIGFQYMGHLSVIKNNTELILNRSGITGLSDSFTVFKNSPHIGTILVFFTDLGFSYVTSYPANELFNQNVALEYIFDKQLIKETEEKLSHSHTDSERITIAENFLLLQLKDYQIDKLVAAAVKLIYESGGAIKISDLGQKLCTSQSPLEKRFRKIVGASPKKFASIVRFTSVLDKLNDMKLLSQICYENNFFDQAHFIKDFKQYTGDTPENFRRHT